MLKRFCKIFGPFHLFSSVYRFSSKDSPWIYSNKYEEFQKMNYGNLYLCWDPGADLHDITLRMYEKLMHADLIVTVPKNRLNIIAMLEALKTKKRWRQSIYVQTQQHEQNIPQNIENQQIQMFSGNQIDKIGQKHFQLLKKQGEDQQLFQQHLQLSKNIQIKEQLWSTQAQIDQNRKNKHIKKINPQEMKKLIQQQHTINDYLGQKTFKKKIKDINNQNGYPIVFEYPEVQNKIRNYLQMGINVTILLDQLNVVANKTILKQLEGSTNMIKKNRIKKVVQQAPLPYQFLPTGNVLLNNIVASGYPADRFSIDYYPKNLTALLIRRKAQTMTVGLIVKGKDLKQTIENIISIYGKSQSVYSSNEIIKHPGTVDSYRDSHFRGQCGLLQEYYIENPPIKQQSYPIIIAPYLGNFNKQLQQSKIQKAQLLGKLHSQKTHMVEMQYLSKKIQKMKKQQNVFKVDTMLLAQCLAKRFQKQQCSEIVSDILGIQGQQLDALVEEGSSNIVPDYLGIFDNKKNLHKKSTQNSITDYE